MSIATQKGYNFYAVNVTNYWKAAGSNRNIYTCLTTGYSRISSSLNYQIVAYRLSKLYNI